MDAVALSVRYHAKITLQLVYRMHRAEQQLRPKFRIGRVVGMVDGSNNTEDWGSHFLNPTVPFFS